MDANKSWIGPAYLGAVLLLGGASAAGLAGNGLLELIGAALIAWSLWTGPGGATATGLRTVGIAGAVLAVLQFVPLPPVLWRHFPGRDTVAAGYDLAGMAAPWLPLSLDPWGSLQSMVWWIPAVAMFLTLRQAGAGSNRALVTVVAGFGYLSVALAAAQVLGGSGYLYAITNRGNGVGLFANSNHFGSFMLIAMALVAGQWLHDRAAAYRLRPAMAKGHMLLLRLAPFALGVFLSNSLACAILLVPVAAAIFLLYRPEIRINWILVLAAVPVTAAAMLGLLSSGLLSNDLMAKSGSAGISRGEFLVNGLAMLKSFAPLGSGLGTFRELYPWFEKLDLVGTTFVNHAHNDLLELLIETGIGGVVLLGLFLRWFAGRLRTVWGSVRARNPLAAAASIAVGAVLIHSLADYPLRTAAVSCLVATCLVLMCRSADHHAARAQAKRAERREPVTI